VADTVLAALAAARGGGAGIEPIEPAGAGCLAPLRRTAALLATPGTDAVVLAATAEGHVALAGLSPVAEPHLAAAATGAGDRADLTLRSRPC
jgi:hypothetical protein